MHPDALERLRPFLQRDGIQVQSLDKFPRLLDYVTPQGVRIGGEKTKPAKVTRLAASEFAIVLTQGLNRQIRRMCSALGWRVKRLVRLRVMHIRLGELPSGRWRELTEAERGPLLRAAARRRMPDRYT